MNSEERAWVAGIYEGEGCLSKAGKYGFRVQVKMCDEDIIRRLHRLTGLGVVRGPIHRNQPNHRPQWDWCIENAVDAAAFSMFIYPWLGERRQARIRELVWPWIEMSDAGRGAFQRQMTHCRSGHAFDEENTLVSGGKRVCRQCKRENRRKRLQDPVKRQRIYDLQNARRRAKKETDRAA